ncbi:MAG TPA: PH domain-containing protein [Thermodesulfobacteriota bacterium]|nr:PH domain-containing protein [Thermodesulfobacteriota bacterium]
MKRHFHSAPWSTSLKLVSLLGAILLGSVAFAAFRAVPAPVGFTHNFGIGVALVPVVVLAASVFFIVSGYTLDPTELSVERLITSTRVPLSGLTRVWADASICKGSIRVFGNGGLFSFSGWFYCKRLGRYRVFATDIRNAVVLQFPDRVIVVSPAAPQAFIQHLQHIVPGLHVGPGLLSSLSPRA